MRSRRISRLASNSVMCVTGQVASPTIVHSSRIAESASPQLRKSDRVSLGVDRTRILASSQVPAELRSSNGSMGNRRFTSTLRSSASDTSALSGMPSNLLMVQSTNVIRCDRDRHSGARLR